MTFLLAADEALRAFVQSHQTPALTAFFLAWTWAGKTTQYGTLVLLLILWLWRMARRPRAAAIIAGATSSVLLMAVIKALVQRGRPPGGVLLGEFGWSFPSGHAMNTMAIVGTAACVCHREGLAPRWAIAAAVGFSLLVGSSRVYLDVHWGSDVLVGWVLGGLQVVFWSWTHRTAMSRVR